MRRPESAQDEFDQVRHDLHERLDLARVICHLPDMVTEELGQKSYSLSVENSISLWNGYSRGRNRPA